MKTTKKWVLAILAALTVLALAACSNAANSDGQAGGAANTDPLNGGAFVIGLDNAFPPYGFIGDDGELTGFDVDLAKMVAEENGWDIKLEAINWDSKDALIESEAISAIWNGFTMEGREDNYTFSKPYMVNRQVIAVKADSDIKSMKDLAGKTIITQADSTADNLFKNEQKELAASFASIETIGDFTQAFLQLDAGTADAVACDLTIFDFQNAKQNGYRVLDEGLSDDEHFAVGFKKGNEALADAVNETLVELDKQGKIEELINKYAQYGMNYERWVLE
ncbi:MAG: transporter substrate-binding domain-containing protein [Coriobacteriia bacterium]|nr:transporter substrate-binding domain-containing protein [Coriobacteriia bacterium]